jgi:hypothetical protein
VTQNAKKPNPAIAKQALKEAANRRKNQLHVEEEGLVRQEEFNGRKGPDPARFGDWENKGIASDF